MTTTNAPHDPIDADARLANRTTLLTLVSLGSFLIALLTIPLTFQRTESAVPRAVASAPLAVGVGAGVMARAARAQLRVLRDEQDEQDEPGRGGAGPASGAP